MNPGGHLLQRRHAPHDETTGEVVGVLPQHNDENEQRHDPGRFRHSLGIVWQPKNWQFLVNKITSNKLLLAAALVLVLVASMILWIVVMILLRLYVYTSAPKTVTIGGRRQSLYHTPFRISMNQLDEQPWNMLIRFLEPSSRQKLRSEAEKVLMEFGDDIREVMLLGADRFGSENPTNVDTIKTKLFQSKIAGMAPWLKHSKKYLNTSHAENPTWPSDQVPSPYNAQAGQDSKVLVICAGDKQIDYLDALLHQIRVIHQSTIAVRVVFKDDQDLSAATLQRLTKTYRQGDLKFINLSERFDLDKSQLKGWNLKAFGMLAVEERQVALLDVDVVLYQSPESLFALPDYQENGALFFRDRSMSQNLWTPQQLLLAMQPHPSPTAQKAMVHGNILNEHLQEAGVVLIDKIRRWRGLWATCLILGREDVRRYIQTNVVYGDKELYFIGFETIHEPYSFARYYPGVVGHVISDFHGIDLEWQELQTHHINITILEPSFSLCGRMLHLDHRGQPLWSNGGYLTREDDRLGSDAAGKGLQPVLYRHGGDSWLDTEGIKGYRGERQNWIFHFGLGVLCFFSHSIPIETVPHASAETGRAAVLYYNDGKRSGK